MANRRLLEEQKWPVEAQLGTGVSDEVGSAGRLLKAGGVSRVEELLYMLLLDHPGSLLSELSDLSKLSRRKTQLALNSLEKKALASHSPEGLRRYFPTPPEVAIEVLVLQQKEALQHMVAGARSLQERARQAARARSAGERMVEVIMGREAHSRLFEQMQKSARDEIVFFDRPPYLSSAPSALNQTQISVAAHGIRYRAVYDSSSLEEPGAADRIRSYAKAGEEAKVYSGVPLKLFAVDHRIAFLALDLARPEDSVLLVRSCALLDAIYDLFEFVWDRAAPLRFDKSGVPEAVSETSDPASDADHVVALLVAGFNDKMIAHQLGISERTLRRRVSEIMVALGARTRFQAGWLCRASKSESSARPESDG